MLCAQSNPSRASSSRVSSSPPTVVPPSSSPLPGRGRFLGRRLGAFPALALPPLSPSPKVALGGATDTHPKPTQCKQPPPTPQLPSPSTARRRVPRSRLLPAPQTTIPPLSTAATTCPAPHATEERRSRHWLPTPRPGLGSSARCGKFQGRGTSAGSGVHSRSRWSYSLAVRTGALASLAP